MSDSLISRIFWGVAEEKQTLFYQKNKNKTSTQHLRIGRNKHDLMQQKYVFFRREPLLYHCIFFNNIITFFFENVWMEILTPYILMNLFYFWSLLE